MVAVTIPKEQFDKQKAVDTVLRLYEVTSRRWNDNTSMVSDLIADARALITYLEETK